MPAFNHNLLSVQKLAKDANCKVNFHRGFCVIHNAITREVQGVGKARNGIYYLVTSHSKT